MPVKLIYKRLLADNIVGPEECKEFPMDVDPAKIRVSPSGPLVFAGKGVLMSLGNRDHIAEWQLMADGAAPAQSGNAEVGILPVDRADIDVLCFALQRIPGAELVGDMAGVAGALERKLTRLKETVKHAKKGIQSEEPKEAVKDEY